MITHVIPMNDIREHIPRIDCWCCPQPDEDEPTIIVHISLDQREKYESGELKAH